MKKSIWIFLAIASLVAASAVAPVYAQKGADSKSTDLHVNINTATAEELTELPGIGEKVAARILAYREKNGGFQKIEEIMNVRGIGEKTFIKLRDHLVVGTDAKKNKSKRKKS